MKILARALAWLIASAVAALDAAVFYVATSSIAHWTVTWPVVAAVFWVQQSFLGYLIWQELRKEGLL